MRARGASRQLQVLAQALGLLAATILSCVSPTLPPDDPPAPDVELGRGVAFLRGSVAVAPAFVLVHNRDTGLIFGQRTASGPYAFEVIAEPCDRLALWYEAGSFRSSAVAFQPAVAAGDRSACRAGSAPTPTQDGGIEQP